MCFCLASNRMSFSATALVDWTQKVLLSNLSYYRLRRELLDEFVSFVGPPPGTITIVLDDEVLLVVRYFLSAKNDGLDDNKRLSFDKAILQVRQAALKAITP